MPFSSPFDFSSSSPNPLASELEAILCAIYNGCKYGIKIRLPHALVMTFLFRRDLSSIDKLKMICKVTLEHSRNLGSFAGIYKTLLALLKYASQSLYWKKRKKVLLRAFGRILGAAFFVKSPYQQPSLEPIPTLSPPGMPQSPSHSFLAGLIGGYTIWGNPSSINYQIVLYLLSRILMGSLSLAKEKYITHNKAIPIAFFKRLKSCTTFDKMYPLLAAGVWAIVMVLFEEYPHVLHPSLRRSMDEIYKFVIDSGGDTFAGQGQALGGGNVGNATDGASALFTSGTSNIEFVEEE
mmetsp:Transcript_14580/g.21377  ORF Transcript_14580/g.21377 Transcript_14580/m.21377 type:complete len:294 (+) Transcript_14580:116-997(+)